MIILHTNQNIVAGAIFIVFIGAYNDHVFRSDAVRFRKPLTCQVHKGIFPVLRQDKNPSARFLGGDIGRIFADISINNALKIIRQRHDLLI